MDWEAEGILCLHEIVTCRVSLLDLVKSDVVVVVW